MYNKKIFQIFIVALTIFMPVFSDKPTFEEENYGVKFATSCEVCKLVTKEIDEKLQETHSSDVIETGYNIDSKKKKTKYNLSELRLVEVLESVCDGMNDYRVHKERQDSTRWAKMMSQTFRTLHGLVNKGVKVNLGIPYELWDEPSAEVAQLKTQCQQFIEDNEDAISDWYFSQGGSDSRTRGTLQAVVCSAILPQQQAECLTEPYGEAIKSEDKEEPQEEEEHEKDAKKMKTSSNKKDNKNRRKKGETQKKIEL